MLRVPLRSAVLEGLVGKGFAISSLVRLRTPHEHGRTSHTGFGIDVVLRCYALRVHHVHLAQLSSDMKTCASLWRIVVFST